MRITGMMCGVLSMVGAVATAQQPEPLISVALFRVEPPNAAAFLAKGREYVPVLEKLRTEGTVTAYGMDLDVLHHPTRSNVAFWYVVANYTNLEKAENAISAFQAKSGELMKATAALTDMAKHQDLILRGVEGNWSKAGTCKTPINVMQINVVKPGKMQDFLASFRNTQKPVLERLVEQGAVCSYEIDVEDIHTVTPGTAWSIVTVPDMAALDKVDAAFKDANSTLSASDRAARARLRAELVEVEKHEDSLSRSVVYAAK